MLPFLIFAAGVALVVAGALMVNLALGIVVGGVVLIAVAWAWENGAPTSG